MICYNDIRYNNIYIQRITMCPHGYHHNGFMATPALGRQDVRLNIVWKDIALWSHQSGQTANSERCIEQIMNVPQRGSPPNPRECPNCLASGRNIQRITMCPHGHHHNGFMATPAERWDTGCTLTHCLEGLHCGVTRVLKLLTVSNE